MTKKQALALLRRKRGRGRPTKALAKKLAQARKIVGCSPRSRGRRRCNPDDLLREDGDPICEMAECSLKPHLCMDCGSWHCHQHPCEEAQWNKNPSVMCGYCGTGNRPGRDLCWKCGFDLGTTSEARLANVARRTARSLGQSQYRRLRRSRRNPQISQSIPSVDFNTLLDHWS